MLMSIFHGKRFIEWRRWFATVKFPIIVLLCGMVNMADVCSSMFFTDNLKIHTLLSSDILYYYNRLFLVWRVTALQIVAERFYMQRIMKQIQYICV